MPYCSRSYQLHQESLEWVFISIQSTGHITITPTKGPEYGTISKCFCQLYKSLPKRSKHFSPTSHQSFPHPRSSCPLLLLTSPLCPLCREASATAAPSSSPNSPGVLSSASVPSSLRFFTFLSSFAVKLLPWFVLSWFILPFGFLCGDP